MEFSVAQKIQNLTSVMECVIKEWKKYSAAITLEEFEQMYEDVSEINKAING